jgi:hypothetical protein
LHLEIDDVELVSHQSEIDLPVAGRTARTIRRFRGRRRAPRGVSSLGSGRHGKQPSLPDAVYVAVMADEGSDRVCSHRSHDAPHCLGSD